MTVVLVTLNKRIDLLTISRRTINAHYFKRRFAASIIRSQNGVGLFFASGSIVISFGSLEHRDQLTSFYLEIIHKVDPTVQMVNSKIVNMTVSASVQQKVFLNRIRKCSYNQESKENIGFVPEIFPGLNRGIPIRKNKNIKLVTFGTGKFNIVGCKSVDEIEESYKNAINWLKRLI